MLFEKKISALTLGQFVMAQWITDITFSVVLGVTLVGVKCFEEEQKKRQTRRNQQYATHDKEA